MDAFSGGLARFFGSPKHAQGLREEHRALKVFMANFGGHVKEVGGTLNVAVSKTSAREIVIGVKEIGIDANGLLELADSLFIELPEGERKPRAT